MSDRYAGLLDTIRKWWNAPEAEKEPAGRDVAESINKVLPETLSARKAIEEDRRRKRKLIDEPTGGG